MDLKRLFKARESKLTTILTQQSKKTVEALRALETYMNAGNEQTAKDIRRMENEADEIRRVLVEELNRSFVTPFDREDLFTLSRTLDDVLDYAYSTVGEMEILQIKPNSYLQRMASILREAVEELDLGITYLVSYPHLALQHASKAKSLENQMEKVYREALADLFKGPKDLDHVMEILKMREIYRHMSNAADRCDETANIIGDIVVKMT